MQIWDTVGNEKFKSITLNYYKTADVVIFMYAINDINSFNSIYKWLDELNDKGNNEEDKNIIKILVGNKKDLLKSDYSGIVGNKFASNYSLKYFETSALSGINVKKVFEILCLDLMNSFQQKELE